MESGRKNRRKTVPDPQMKSKSTLVTELAHIHSALGKISMRDTIPVFMVLTF